MPRTPYTTVLSPICYRFENLHDGVVIEDLPQELHMFTYRKTTFETEERRRKQMKMEEDVHKFLDTLRSRGRYAVLGNGMVSLLASCPSHPLKKSVPSALRRTCFPGCGIFSANTGGARKELLERGVCAAVVSRTRGASRQSYGVAYLHST